MNRPSPPDDQRAAAPRDCIRGKIRRALVERIVSGEYPPGQRLVELKIAREFATSQGPVREALRELESLRLVESQTYRGTRVRALNETEMWEHAQVRGMLEQAAAVAAASAMDGDVEDLRRDLEDLRRTASHGDKPGYARANREFHRRIVAAAGNTVLLRIWDSLMLETRTRVALSHLTLNLPVVADTHVPIIEALERGDGPTAGSLLREHAELFGKRPPDRFVATSSASPGSPPG